MPKIEFTQEQIEYIIEAYIQEHKTMTAIGKEFNVSSTPIKRVLNENNIEIRHGHFEDLTFQRFGKLVAQHIDPDGPRGSGRHTRWICLCDCGNTVSVQSNHLKEGTQSACSPICNHLIPKGTRFGGLVVIEPTEMRSKNGGAVMYKCRCDCSKECLVSSTELRAHRKGSCETCKESYGEAAIRHLLSINNVVFEKEKTFEDCINPETKAKYRFDFYVDNNYIVEFDGEQHFKPVDMFGGQEYYETVQARDANKNLYCKNKNIPIIRIPYYHLNKITIEDLKLETSTFIVR